MYITRYTDYSLRVLIFLALKGEEQATIGEIAERYDISKNHLMKVVQELNAKGYVLATRGKKGGLLLSRPAEEINIGELVRSIEVDFSLVECFQQEHNCIISPACKLKMVLYEALTAFLTTLDQYTLADLLPASNQKSLIKLLQL